MRSLIVKMLKGLKMLTLLTVFEMQKWCLVVFWHHRGYLIQCQALFEDILKTRITLLDSGDGRVCWMISSTSAVPFTLCSLCHCKNIGLLVKQWKLIGGVSWVYTSIYNQHYLLTGIYYTYHCYLCNFSCIQVSSIMSFWNYFFWESLFPGKSGPIWNDHITKRKLSLLF